MLKYLKLINEMPFILKYIKKYKMLIYFSLIRKLISILDYQIIIK